MPLVFLLFTINALNDVIVYFKQQRMTLRWFRYLKQIILQSQLFMANSVTMWSLVDAAKGCTMWDRKYTVFVVNVDGNN